MSPGCVGRPRMPTCYPDATSRAPSSVGDYSKVEAGAELREFTVVGSNVVIKAGRLPAPGRRRRQRADFGPRANLRGCVIGKGTDVRRAARIEEGAVVGGGLRRRGGGVSSPHDVRVYPYKTIEAGAVVNTSVIWESRGSGRCSGRAASPAWSTSEITPELAVRLAAAYATTLLEGRDRHDRPGRLAGRPGAQARGDQPRSPPARSMSATWRSRRCRSPGSTCGLSDAAGGIMIHYDPRGDP